MKFKKRVRGTPKQIGKPFPISERKKLPKLALRKEWTPRGIKQLEEAFEAEKLRKLLTRISKLTLPQLEKWADSHPKESLKLHNLGYLEMWRQYGKDFIDLSKKATDFLEGIKSGGKVRLRKFYVRAIVDVHECYRKKGSPVYDPQYAEKQIADMLRYDDGTITSKKDLGDKVVFEIASDRFTPRRWASFKIKAEGCLEKERKYK